MRWVLGLILFLLWPVGSFVEAAEPVDAQFRAAVPGYRFSFPRDHGGHSAYQTEWWYYTGHLHSDNGRRFGYQLTFFRRGLHRVTADQETALRSAWRIDDLYLAHLAVSDLREGRFRFAERLSREGLGKAGADEERLHVWIDHWQIEMPDPNGASHHLAATAGDLRLDLSLTPAKPPIIHGTDGVSVKGTEPDRASHYYSLTRLATSGRLTVDGRTFSVTGQSWMDHEFGSGDLSEDLVGWDWFSVQLDSGEELMLYRLRRPDGRTHGASSGTWVDRRGSPQHLTVEAARVEVTDHWTSPHSHTRYPSQWRITIPSLRAYFELVPLLADQELRTTRSTQITYWEGAVRISGTLGDSPASGRGYVELTGYDTPYRPGVPSDPRGTP